MASLTLAKKIFVENHKRFPGLKSIEYTRSTFVRSIRGLRGEAHRRLIKDKSQFQPATYDTNNYRPYKEEINTSAKILILDIETAPARALVWDIWKQDIATDFIERDWFMLTWSAKWLFEKKVYSAGLTSKEAVAQDDKRISKGIWDLLNQADIVIAHNGEKFDVPRLNTRFLIHNFSPPLPYQQIDTLKHIRRQFAFLSNKLDFVNQILNLPRKTETGRELWKKCYIGDSEALKKMEKYNANDVLILENTYLRLRPWIKPHPNIGLHILDEKESRCPTCGSNELKSHGKNYHTTANVYELLRCDNCGAASRKRLSSIEIKQRRHLTLSVAK